MGNTDTNYSTNKTLMDYFNANIDVHINYLLFLNSFKSISSNIGFLEIAPKLENIREKLYQAFDYNLIPDGTKQVNMLIEQKLAELLDEANLSETKKFIGADLSKEDIINLSTIIFLKNSINTTLSINENDFLEKKIIASTLDKIINSIPSVDININGYSFELVSYFLESLKIKSEKNKSAVSYIYDFICNANLINSMLSRQDTNTRISLESDFLRKDLFDSLYISSNFSLANLVDELNYNLKAIVRKDNKDFILEKHMLK